MIFFVSGRMAEFFGHPCLYKRSTRLRQLESIAKLIFDKY